MVSGEGSSDPFGTLRIPIYHAGRGSDPRSDNNDGRCGGVNVEKTDIGTEKATNNQVIFPMAVGFLFLLVLVAGALLG